MTRNILIGLTVLLFACNGQRKSENIDNEIFSTIDKKIKIQVDSKSQYKIKVANISNVDSSYNVSVGFDSTGKVLYTSISTNGIHRHSIEYYKNGRPKGLVNFDSTTTGDAIYYYENGNKKSEGRWENARQIGIWKNYNDKGEMIKIDTLE